ncbi:hypothetical protein FSP39_009421 [Pinctada imbricata]|uniref:Uncharacterized protein n=1 Tax=Pinctada imbricata TaxID=66713 RepID=A0AA88Y9T4_PINIB|nr:hypothetical protein FSP39_009421 [Pinctada imbricata]
MMRRKGRDVAESLELGSAVHFTQHVPVRKFTSLKIFKYLILIALGVLIHSMYKRIMQVHSGTPDVEDVGKRLKDIEDKLNSNQNVERVNDQKEKIKDLTDEIFDEANKKQIEKEKLEAIKEQVKSELKEEQKREELTKNDELLKAINQKLKDKDHSLDDDIKEQAVEAKFDPTDEAEKKELQDEMAIENDIAQILDTVNEEHKDEPTDSEEQEEVDEAQIPSESEEAKNVIVKPPEPGSNHAFLNEPRVVNNKPVKKTFLDKSFKLGERFNPEKLPYKGHHSHELPALVTAASRKTMNQVFQLIESIQKFFSDGRLYVFDLDLNEHERKKISSACNVRLRAFWKNLFPDFVQNLTLNHWRPLVIQTALAEFGDIIWINPDVRVTSSKLKQVMHETEESGVMLIGQSVAHTTYAVTHPKMYKFIRTNKNKLYQAPHIQMMGLIIHSTQTVHKNFMKILTACAIEKDCMSPKGSKWDCDFDFTGKLYAYCHRYDESAINIILRNMFDFDDSKFYRGNSFFQPYDDQMRPHLKYCREQN